MVVFLRSGCETGSSVLHSLESSEKMVRNAIQRAVSIVRARRPVGMNHHFCGFLPMQWRWKYATRHMCCTWLFMPRASSKKTPMFLATVEICTMVLPSSMCGIESLFLICGAHT